MKRKRNNIIIALLFLSLSSLAQPKTLSWEEFKNAIEQYHPIAQKAALLPKYAQADLGIARSSFDPSLEAAQSEKSIQNINYYSSQNLALKLPLWYGIDVSTGTDNLFGQRLNPSDTKGQLYYVGANVSLLRNLITDKRRTALRQAYLSKEMSELEKKVLLNDLLMEAAQVYWEWTRAYANRKIINEGVINLQQRVAFIHENILHGERAIIDSIELEATLQSFLTRKNQIELEWQNASLQVSSFLWKNDASAYDLPSDVTPFYDLTNYSIEDIFITQTKVVKTSPDQHPSLFWYDKKIGQLTLDQKLKRQELLPKLDLKYNYWMKPNYPSLPSNYSFGLQFQMPVTLAFSRNQLKNANLKIQEAELVKQDKQRQINLKFKSYLNEADFLNLQLKAQATAVNATKLLLEAERQKFNIGESSVFMINQREQKYLETIEKLIELKSKALKVNQSIQWSLGLLPSN
jgi:outer membrane protein TolC